jgi:cytochrome c peroxidase
MKQASRFIVFIFFGLISFAFNGCNSREISLLGPISYPDLNPLNAKKAELGKMLFFDKRLSFDNTISCSTCHNPALAFTDGKKLSVGAHGRFSMRNAPSLLNVGYQKTLMADGQVPSIEMQALVPLQDTSEMANNIKVVLEKLNSIEYYKQAAKEIFNRKFDAFVLTQSLANYQRTLVSNNSSFDRYMYHKEKNVISKQAQSGWEIFSKELYCTKCHTPPLFTNLKVENNGLYSNYKNRVDKGRFRINGDSSEIGSFKVPTLRNISLTAPYMHDGSLKSIEDVLEFYSKGGNRNVNQNPTIQPFILTKEKKRDLKAFLLSLEEL